MHKAAKEGHEKVIETMLEHDKVLDKEPTDHLGKTPAQFAVDWGHEKIVRMFSQYRVALEPGSLEYCKIMARSNSVYYS